MADLAVTDYTTIASWHGHGSNGRKFYYKKISFDPDTLLAATNHAAALGMRELVGCYSGFDVTNSEPLITAIDETGQIRMLADAGSAPVGSADCRLIVFGFPA